MSLRRLGYRAFGRLPRRWMTRLVRWGSPNYTVGTMLAVRRSDGAVLLQRNEHRNEWGLPGGLVRRGERPVDGARRELAEETGLSVEVADDPVYVLEPKAQRVDVVFTVEVGQESRPEAFAEVIEVRWWPADAMPELHSHSVSAIEALQRAGRWVSG